MTGVLLQLALTGLALAALLAGLGLLVDRAPLPSAQRDALARARTVVTALALLLFALHAAARLFEARPGLVPLALAAVLAAATLATWFALRDLAAGVVLRAGGLLAVGTSIRADAVEGRVERLGARVLVLRTSAGEERVVPYAELARASFTRLPSAERAGRRVFEVAAPVDESLGEVSRRIEAAALGSHWAALGQLPEVAPRGADRLEVTVFALDAEHAADVEAAVRAALTSP